MAEIGTAEALEKLVDRREYWPDDLAFLHIYPQCAWHSEAQIIGSKEGLQALADACLRAIGEGKGDAEVLARDGEGYGVEVRRTNCVGMSYTRLPYLSDVACQTPQAYVDSLRKDLEEADSLLRALAAERAKPVQIVEG